MYKVIKFFTDLQDNQHPYYVGDVYPREGVTVNQKRFDELSSNKNRQKTPLIKKVDDAPESAEINDGPTEPKKKRSRSK